MESYQKENKLKPLPILLCGYVFLSRFRFPILTRDETQARLFGCGSDWNGSKRGHIYKFLRSQGFVSSYDTAHQYTDADAHRVPFFLESTIVSHVFEFFRFKNSYLWCRTFVQWVSHRNHRGNICGVDFIWLLNPNRYRKLLNASWSEALLGMFKVRYLIFK